MFPLRLYVFLQVIQIMVALIVMVFGILRATRSKGLVPDCMVYIWGPVMFIIAGSMMGLHRDLRSVTHLCDVTLASKSAVVLNVAAGVTSLVTAMVFFLDASQAFTNSNPGQSDLDMSSQAISGFSAILCLIQLMLCGCSAGVGKPGGCCDPTRQHYGNASVTVQTPQTWTNPQ
ncbi:unnamed protein product [Oreochromis niloticus]|nr:unnamed protein product [Mustela putorius furo]